MPHLETQIGRENLVEAYICVGMEILMKMKEIFKN